MANLIYLIMYSLIALGSSQAIYAINYNVINNAKDKPGGQRFEREIGVPYTKQIMGTINNFIYKMFQQNSPGDRRHQDEVNVTITEYNGAEAITMGNVVNVSSLYLQGYQGDLKWEFTSLLYHEMTHVFQWIPPTAPTGLIEGIADYTILKANYYPPGFAKPGMGDRWDQGYDFTARFLEYCNSLKGGFVAELNKRMRDSYSDNYFVEILGKPVDQLWKEYKAKYKSF